MELGVNNMAGKGIPMVYTPVDYSKISFPDEAQFNMYDDSNYQKGWNERDKSYPKQYYDVSSPQNTRSQARSAYVPEKHKNVKSQVQRPLSMKTENGERVPEIHKPLQKSKSIHVDEGKHNKNCKGSAGFYPGLQKMINTYSDNFGYRKDNLYSEYCDPHVRKTNSAGFELSSYDNLGKSSGYELSSYDNVGKSNSTRDGLSICHNMGKGNSAGCELENYNSSAGKDNPDGYKLKHIPFTPLDPQLRKERILHPRSHSLVTPCKVTPTNERRHDSPKQESYVYEANQPEQRSSSFTSHNVISSATSPPITVSPRKIPPPVKPKSRKVLRMKTISEDENERSSIPKLVDLCENILRKLKAWEEITKVVTELVPQLEVLVTLLLTSIEGDTQRKSSLTESIASALDSFSFLGGGDENDSVHNTFTHSGDSSPSHISRNKRPTYCRTIFHHLCGLHDLVDGFRPSAGPLSTRQESYYDKMRQQNMVITQISQLMVDGDHISPMSACDRFCETKTLAQVWRSCAANEHPMYCTCEKMRKALDHHCPYLVDGEDDNNDNYVNSEDIREGVCSMVVKKICELDIYTTDQKVITVFQFVGFFKNKVKHYNVMEYMKKSIEEFLMLKVLFSKDDLLVMSTLQQYGKIPVVKSCIHCLLSYLAGDKISRKRASLHVLTKIYENPENRPIMLNIMTASLEESNIEIKAGACIALGKLKVQGISKKLIYLYKTETLLAKEAAEEGLKDLGHNLIRR